MHDIEFYNVNTSNLLLITRYEKNILKAIEMKIISIKTTVF